MPFAAHGAKELPAQGSPDLAMPGPIKRIELHQHRNGADEAGRIGPGGGLSRGVLWHEIERHRIDEERLEGDVEIAEQRHHLI